MTEWETSWRESVTLMSIKTCRLRHYPSMLRSSFRRWRRSSNLWMLEYKTGNNKWKTKLISQSSTGLTFHPSFLKRAFTSIIHQDGRWFFTILVHFSVLDFRHSTTCTIPIQNKSWTFSSDLTMLVFVWWSLEAVLLPSTTALPVTNYKNGETSTWLWFMDSVHSPWESWCTHILTKIISRQ